MIDLHLHLDGAISPASARKLAALQGIAVPESEEELLRLLRVSDDCSDLNEFLEKFAFPCSLLMTYEGVRQAMENLLQELHNLGVWYAEVRFAPQLSVGQGISQEDAVRAALEGIRKAPIMANLILCCMRMDDNREANLETVRLAEKYRGKGVAALDLAGAEALYPAERYADIFALAREKQIPFTIHAGEAAGPESIRAALALGASRIGHGVRAMEDPALLRELVERQIPLELCPTSNVKTAIFPNLESYPLPALLESGALVTINSDDPSIEGTDIRQEYEAMTRIFHLDAKTVRQLLLNAVKASFASPAQKQALQERIANQQ